MTDTTTSRPDPGGRADGKGTPPKDPTVTVTLNEDHTVVLNGRNHTGADIKAAAIAQGVPIQADFVLSEVLPNGKQKIVRDDRTVNVKDGDEFWAIPGDDNS
jgi:hypothetical protein